MKWYVGLESIVQENVPLAALTWYRTGGCARYYCRPNSPEQLVEVVSRARQHGLPIKVLGAGANVLVRDEGYPGVVLHLMQSSLARIRFVRLDVERDAFNSAVSSSSTRCIGTARTDCIAGAAAGLPNLVRMSVRAGLSGLECLAGIPGSVGGAIRMNAGGRFGEIGSVVAGVTILDSQSRVRFCEKPELAFAYRSSNLGDHIVLDARFALTPTDPEVVNARYQEIWEYKRQTQPFSQRSAGCVFRNPPGGSAGQLIDRAGFKGIRCGGASVSDKHANFIVADEGTRARDILELADRIRERVLSEFHTNLELEIDVW